jgi:DcuC family C4-dicarboxylate transporter
MIALASGGFDSPYEGSYVRAKGATTRSAARSWRLVAVALGIAIVLGTMTSIRAADPGASGAAGNPRSSISAPPAWGPVGIAAADLVVVTVLVAMGLEVRLVLLLGAVPLFLATGTMPQMLERMVAEMANPKTVVPIGAAMGFAFVLRNTGCDRHLVELLLVPVRRVRPLLIPGGIAAGYLINTTIVSQAGTASVLGPILLPLLRAGGLAPAHAGAVLLLGASMGGELFNPGAVEMQKLAELTRLPGPVVVSRSAGLNLTACSVALVTFWILTLRRFRRAGTELAGVPSAEEAASPAFRVNPFKAIVPVLPLAILLGTSLLGHRSPLSALEGPSRILAAMLIGIVAAGLTSPRSIRGVTAAFFEGAAYAYHHVISLIVPASTFAEGVRLSGLIAVVIHAIAGWPEVAMIAGVVAPWCLAVISGTGIAPAVAIMEFFVPAAGSMGLDPVRLGTVSALGAHFGRTMSPAAAVVMVASTLAGARAADLIRHVAPPLLAGGIVLIAAALLKFP